MNRDEITMLRDIRPADVPYDPAARTRARAGMFAARRRGPGWKTALALGVTGALTAGLLVVGGGDGGGVSNPLVQPVAARYLERAAQVVEQTPDVRPKPHQWLYRKTTMKDSDSPKLRSHESWMRADGLWAASRENGGIVRDQQYPTKDEPGPLGEYEKLLTLPTAPALLRGWAYGKADERFAKMARLGLLPDGPPTEDARHAAAFQNLTNLFELLSPPALRAAAFRAIALIPGVEVLPETTDILGRPVFTIGRMDEYGTRAEEQVDRTTYAHRAWGTVVVRNDLKQRPGGLRRGADGTAVAAPPVPPPPVGRSHHEALASSAVVAEPGATG